MSKMLALKGLLDSAPINVVKEKIVETAPLALNQDLNSLTNSTLNSTLNTAANVINGSANIASNVAQQASTFLGIDFSNLSGTTLAIIGAGLAVGLSGIASALGAGITGVSGARASAKDQKNFSTSLLFQALPQTQGIYGFLVAILILLGAGVIGTANQISIAQGFGAIGAGLAVGLAAISAIGQGIAASNGISASAENKNVLGKSILFSVLPETQALYGFLIAILILVGTGFFGSLNSPLPLTVGLACIAAGLAVGLAGVSAIGQGIAASNGISALLKDAKSFSKSMIFSVLPETQALYGFIIAVLILVGFGVLTGIPRDLGFPIALISIAAGFAVGLAAVSSIGQGKVAAEGISVNVEDNKMFGKGILFSVLPETQALYGFLVAVLLLIGGGILGAAKSNISLAIGLGTIGSGFAVGLGAISAIGQGNVAASSIRSLLKRSERFGKNMIFSVLPETQALYGFIIAILLLVGFGILTNNPNLSITIPIALISIGAGLAVGLGAISAIGQGDAASAGVIATEHDENLFGRSILFSVLPETQALYGFLIAILLLVGAGILGSITKLFTIPLGFVAIGASLAVGIAAISAIGQGIVANSSIINMLQKPKLFGRGILFSVLPETQALYGFLIAILLLVGGGFLSQVNSNFTLGLSLIALAAGVAVGLAAVSAIGQGIVAASGISAVESNEKMFGRSILFSVLPETQALYGFLIAVLLLVGGGIVGSIKLGITAPLGIIALGAALSVGLGAISAIGQGISASTGVSAVSNKSEMFGKSIIFSILPETQALICFLISILILIGSGLLGGIKLGLEMPTGLIALAAGLAVGLAAISAYGQGFVVSSSIMSTLKDPKNFGKSLLFSVLPQTQALYGFLISILLLIGGGILTSISNLNLSVGLLAIGAGIAVGLSAVSAVGQGIAAGAGARIVAEDNKMFGRSILFSVLPETQALYGFLIAILLIVSGGLLGSKVPDFSVNIGLVAIGAGISVGLAAFSAIGQGITASSGSASVKENEKLFGKSIIFSILPETQALYGIIISILLMTGVGLLGSLKEGISLLQGLGGLGAGLTMGLASLSAIGQGLVASSSIGSTLQDEKSTGKSLIMSVIPETYAIFGLLVAVLMLIGLKMI